MTKFRHWLLYGDDKVVIIMEKMQMPGGMEWLDVCEAD
jgi:hypothetical protein